MENETKTEKTDISIIKNSGPESPACLENTADTKDSTDIEDGKTSNDAEGTPDVSKCNPEPIAVEKSEHDIKATPAPTACASEAIEVEKSGHDSDATPVVVLCNTEQTDVQKSENDSETTSVCVSEGIEVEKSGHVSEKNPAVCHPKTIHVEKTEDDLEASPADVCPPAPIACTKSGSQMNMIPSSEEQGLLAQKLSTLQTRAKNLRQKIGNGLGRGSVQLQKLMVEQSEQQQRQNDTQAVASMIKLEAANMVQKNMNSRSACDTSSSSGVGLSATQSFTEPKSKTPGPGRTYKKVPRRELEAKLVGIEELMRELTLQNPQFEEKMRQLVQSNPKYKDLDLFPSNTNGRNHLHNQQPTCSSNVLSNIPNNIRRKPRQDSELSNSSSQSQSNGKQQRNIKMSQTVTVQNTQVQNKTTKEQKTFDSSKTINSKKRNNSVLTNNKETEQEALVKYINQIVEETQSDKKLEYVFKKGDDLEAYAQRLVQGGLGRIVESEIRINRKNNRQCFLSAQSEGIERDAIIPIPVARQYAFEGDTVRAFVINAEIANNTETTKEPESSNNNVEGGKENSFCVDDDGSFPDDESPDSDGDVNEVDITTVSNSNGNPKAFVISIVRQSEKRQVVGTISFKNSIKRNDDQSYYKLHPHDMRVPMVYIPTESCENHISDEQKNDICGFLYVARVCKTDVYGKCIGELDQPVGKVGNLEDEIKAILLHNGLKDVRPYEERFNEMFAQPDPPPSAEEMSKREDLRNKCVFTIDPLTARDLDDAMSIEFLNDDICEVGVHISDVAHYLLEDSELDNIVKDRATSIYLVNEVIHMLPKPLCFKCSLLPGEDKRAFSVFWKMNVQGDIIDKPRFTRSIIKSCTQFAYEHAQKIIDNPNENFAVDDFPTICNGFTPNDIVKRVLALDKIAKCLRAKRYDGGALSIHNPKLRFNMDPVSGEPISYEVDGRQEANFLIEEFMLLANQSVARFIFDHFPDISILRNHAPPLSKSLKSLKEKLANLGIEFDFTSSKAIYESMQRISKSAQDPEAMEACLSTLLTKPMARAKYFCSEGHSEESDLWHYALSIPIYTHFTSPIRRYPDILVHRILAAALNYCPPPKRTTDELHTMAKVCNDQKYNAKNAGDESTNLFFKRYIKSKQSIVLRAVVTEIYQHLINVVTVKTGHSISIKYSMQKVLVDTRNAPGFILIYEKNSKISPLKLKLFSSVDIKLVVWDGKICGFFVSPDPKQRQKNSIESTKNSNSSGNGNPQVNNGKSGRKPKDKRSEIEKQKATSTRKYAVRMSNQN